MTEQDWSGLVGIILIFGTTAAILLWLVHVAKIEWFRRRLLHFDRTQGFIGAAPVAIPVFLFYMIFVRPLFP